MPRPVTAKARLILVAPLSEAAVDALRQQLQPVITPVEDSGHELNFDVDFDDVMDYVGIGQTGPAARSNLKRSC